MENNELQWLSDIDSMYVLCIEGPAAILRDTKSKQGVRVNSIEFFNNNDAILNFEHIAMHCGLSRVIQLF